MTDQNLLLSEDGYPNAPADIKQALRDARNHAAVAHIEQLERDLAEARKDVSRLDWLTSQKGCAVDEGTKGFWLYWYDGFVVKTYQDSEFPTARAAIDAAIAKDTP